MEGPANPADVAANSPLVCVALRPPTAEACAAAHQISLRLDYSSQPSPLNPQSLGQNRHSRSRSCDSLGFDNDGDGRGERGGGNNRGTDRDSFSGLEGGAGGFDNDGDGRGERGGGNRGTDRDSFSGLEGGAGGFDNDGDGRGERGGGNRGTDPDSVSGNRGGDRRGWFWGSAVVSAGAAALFGACLLRYMASQPKFWIGSIVNLNLLSNSGSQRLEQTVTFKLATEHVKTMWELILAHLGAKPK